MQARIIAADRRNSIKIKCHNVSRPVRKPILDVAKEGLAGTGKPHDRSGLEWGCGPLGTSQINPETDGIDLAQQPIDSSATASFDSPLRCRMLARTGPDPMSDLSPASRSKRTWGFEAVRAAFDPDQTPATQRKRRLCSAVGSSVKTVDSGIVARCLSRPVFGLCPTFRRQELASNRPWTCYLHAECFYASARFVRPRQ